MSEYLGIIGRRLDRAKKQFEELGREADSFIDSDAVQLIRVAKREGEEMVTTFTLEVNKAIPDHLRLIFGDSINNMRSACDNFVVQLGNDRRITKPGGGVVQEKELQFPVFRDRRKFEQFKKKFVFAQGIAEVLESVQPYNPYVNKYGRQFVDEFHPLHVASELWNVQKHRLPLKIVGITPQSTIESNGLAMVSNASNVVTQATFNVRYKEEDHMEWRTVAKAELMTGNVVESGKEYAKISVPLSEAKRQAESQVLIVMVLAEGSPAPGAPAVQLLGDLHGYITQQIYDRLAPFCALDSKGGK
ncbi:hypothetical protein BH11ARM1_BH11ARM1_04600 [soil metagenome]